MDHVLPIDRARRSLEGLSCGDAFGERFFLPVSVVDSLIEQRALPAPPWFYTDDTLMAISIVSTLEKHGTIDQDYLASDFGNRYDSGRGYGPAMHELLPKLRRQPSSWNHESEALFGGTGSFGNGSAMRVAPLGAYFADDLDKLNAEAERSAVVTHCHAEAVAGAVAVAMAAAVATQAANRENALTFSEFLDQVRERTPSSTVQSGIRRAIEIGPDVPVSTAVQALGNGKRVSAPDTVPFCLWAAARHLSDYEAAMWTTVSGLGDRDTTCAIVGGIVVMSAGLDSIPKAWLEHREPLGK